MGEANFYYFTCLNIFTRSFYTPKTFYV